MSQVHPCARTTPRTRAEINASPAGATALAWRYNITVATARKCKASAKQVQRARKIASTIHRFIAFATSRPSSITAIA